MSEFLEALLADGSMIKNLFGRIHNPISLSKNIAKALVFIKGYLEQKPEEEIEAFGNFIYHNVKLIKNTTATRN